MAGFDDREPDQLAALGPSRRGLLRRGFGAAVAAGLAVAGAGLAWPHGTAEAGEDMCDGDPLILVDGKLVQIQVSMPRSALAQVSTANPVRIRIEAPQNVLVKVVGYTGVIPERVEFNPDKAPAAALDIFSQLDFSVYFPQSGAAYSGSFKATSLLQTMQVTLPSATWRGFSLRTPRVPLPSLTLAQASVTLCAPGIGVLGL